MLKKQKIFFSLMIGFISLSFLLGYGKEAKGADIMDCWVKLGNLYSCKDVKDCGCTDLSKPVVLQGATYSKCGTTYPFIQGAYYNDIYINACTGDAWCSNHGVPSEQGCYYISAWSACPNPKVTWGSAKSYKAGDTCEDAPMPDCTGACSATKDTCTNGTVSDLTDTATNYQWKCLGINGGTNSGTCTAAIPTTPTAVNGACSDPQTHYDCSAGDLGYNVEYPNSVLPTTYAWAWLCNGLNGGTNIVCLEWKDAVIGVCSAIAETCTSGTSSDSPADTATNYQWTCLGSGGGSNSGTCTASKGCSCGDTNSYPCGTPYSDGCTANACTGTANCPSCGDGSCNGEETCSNCSTDCGACCSPSCGNTDDHCSGDTYRNGCPGGENACRGTGAGTCNEAGTHCPGVTYNDSCGNPTCTDGTLPQNCGPWMWGGEENGCSKSCGGSGIQTKTCSCPPETQTQGCNSQPCPPSYREATPW